MADFIEALPIYLSNTSEHTTLSNMGYYPTESGTDVSIVEQVDWLEHAGLHNLQAQIYILWTLLVILTLIISVLCCRIIRQNRHEQPDIEMVVQARRISVG